MGTSSQEGMPALRSSARSEEVDFIKLKEFLATNKQLREKIESMERKYDKKLKEVFDVLKKLLIQEEKPRKKMGFML